MNPITTKYEKFQEHLKSNQYTWLVTGGAGFIGTNFIRHALAVRPDWNIVNLDALTYAGNPANLENLDPGIADRYRFVRGDICDAELLDSLFLKYNFNGVIHFAAESHVDRSIQGPEDFVETNVMGTFRLLEACRKLRQNKKMPDGFRDLVDDRLGRSRNNSGRRLIRFVTDRPGHDRRYAIDATKIKTDLGWTSVHTLEQALESTVDWYLNNMKWVDSVQSGEYRKWIEQNYQHRGVTS